MFKTAGDAFAIPVKSADSLVTVLLIFGVFAKFSRKPYASEIFLHGMLPQVTI